MQQMDGRHSFVRVTILTAAVSAGFAGSAQAAFISTASGLPHTFQMGSNSTYAIDLNANGSTDINIYTSTGAIGVSPGTNSVVTTSGDVKSFSSLSAF